MPDKEIATKITQWNILTLADILKPLPEQHYAIHGIFARPSLSILYGSPGSLKSLILADAAVHVAAGIPWLPPLPKLQCEPWQVEKTPVLWLDFDNGARRTKNRIAAVCRKLKIKEPDVPIFVVTMQQPQLNANDNGHIADLVNIATNPQIKAGFVIMDNLGIISGGVDENSNEMAHVMGNLRWFTEQSDTATVLIHHPRKSIGNGQVVRVGDSLRGHSSIEAALDLALLAEREENSASIGIKSTKSRDVDVKGFGAMFTYTHIFDENGKETNDLDEAGFYGMVVESSARDYEIDAVVLDVLSDIKPISMKQGDLVKRIQSEFSQDSKPGEKRIKGRLEYLYSNGTISRDGKGQGRGNSYVYGLP